MESLSQFIVPLVTVALVFIGYRLMLGSKVRKAVERAGTSYVAAKAQQIEVTLKEEALINALDFNEEIKEYGITDAKSAKAAKDLHASLIS